ncbi:MAG TPA: hypothetical protein VLY24_31760 [Bryobacteraceae bacterium]|nr:hypothetical protein [Bryobacteraceae bacterium]
MTIDERLDRLEHITAGMFEQWQKEREEDRQLWRDTQRQIEETDRHLGSESKRLIRGLGTESISLLPSPVPLPPSPAPPITSFVSGSIAWNPPWAKVTSLDESASVLTCSVRPASTSGGN